ncbi:MAG: KilA-N domain-containing protein [Clostridia bacterium]|nr:KilA-N domain-containing protein [Clostridia bacterium]
MMLTKLEADGREVRVCDVGGNDYISLTDIAKYKSDEPKDVVKNWLRSKSTIEFLGLWEKLNNPHFKGVEFDTFKMKAGSNAFTISPQQWIQTTDAMGLISKSGRKCLITPTLSPQEMVYTYASEADLLNVALFGKTAGMWRRERDISGTTPNIRDYASIEELVVLINLEDTNADLIKQGVPQLERLKILREKAYCQLKLLTEQSLNFLPGNP